MSRQMNDKSLIWNGKFNYQTSQDPFIKAVGAILDSQSCTYNSCSDLLLNGKRFEILEKAYLHDVINFFIYKRYIKLSIDKNGDYYLIANKNIDGQSFKNTFGLHGKVYRNWISKNTFTSHEGEWVFIGMGNDFEKYGISNESVMGPRKHPYEALKTNSYFVKYNTV